MSKKSINKYLPIRIHHLLFSSPLLFLFIPFIQVYIKLENKKSCRICFSFHFVIAVELNKCNLIIKHYFLPFSNIIFKSLSVIRTTTTKN